MINVNNIMRIDFIYKLGGFDIPQTLLFNITQISEDDVLELIKNDAWEYDDRLIKISSEQLKYLEDKEVV